MSDSIPANSPSSEPGKEIPTAQAEEIRRLAHDLSNALEIILQSSYLLGTAQIEESAKPWLGLLNQGVERASTLNKELRDYIRQHS